MTIAPDSAINGLVHAGAAHVSLQPVETGLSDENRICSIVTSAFQLYDVDALVSLLREDATMSMPVCVRLQGPDSQGVAALSRRGRVRGVPARVEPRQPPPAFAPYRLQADGSLAAWGSSSIESGLWRDSPWNNVSGRREPFPLLLTDDAQQPMIFRGAGRSIPPHVLSTGGYSMSATIRRTLDFTPPVLRCHHLARVASGPAALSRHHLDPSFGG